MSNQTTNPFETAARLKLRFTSPKGPLTVEQLFDLPLTSKHDDLSLDLVAKTTNKELLAVSEESFVSDNLHNPARDRLSLALEIVKHVIHVKQEEAETKRRRAETEAKKGRIMEIIAKKQDGKLEEMSEKELMKILASLD